MKKIFLLAISILALSFGGSNSFATDGSCKDIEFVYARSSGAERNNSAEWKQFRSSMKKIAKRRGYTYRITDLDYPAISILDPKVALGAKIGSGKAFAFGRSVATGVENLRKYYKNTVRKCPSTKWVLGGYSQGALVIARAVSGISASKVIYVGLFGDPWTNLPEGKGIFPSACFGKNLSKYRVYAPDCFTHTGTLGAKNPYVLSGYKNKYGLWCNDDDYFCGSSRSLLNTAGHAQYATKKEFIWMADIVERKLPQHADNATAVMRSVDIDDDEPEDIIQAHFPVDEYYVDKMGDVEFDASSSFSTGHEIVEYQWSINGGDFVSSGEDPSMQLHIVSPEVTEVTVRVIDDIGNTAETSAKAFARNNVVHDNTMSSPRDVTADCMDGQISLKWAEEWPKQAQYLLVRLNGVDLDYVPVEKKSVMIDGIDDYHDISSLKVAWLDQNYELSEWADVIINCPKTVREEPVETGVDLANSSLLVAILGVAVCVLIYKKYLPR